MKGMVSTCGSGSRLYFLTMELVNNSFQYCYNTMTYYTLIGSMVADFYKTLIVCRKKYHKLKIISKYTTKSR